MTITKKCLRDLEKATFTTITPEQNEIILERFGTEPEPHVWTDEDIFIQIRNYLECGEFMKSISTVGAGDTLPPGVDF